MEFIKNIKDLFKPVLSDRTILKYNAKNLLIEGELTEAQIQPNSIDLTLGNTWKKIKHNRIDTLDFTNKEIKFNNNATIFTTHKSIDTRKEIQYDTGLFQKDEESGMEYYKLMPNEFVLMASQEILNIPNGILSFVQGRSSIARLGIQTEQAGLIDAGFRGTITLEVFNQSSYPIYLYKGMRIAQVYFFKAQYADRLYGIKNNSKYQNQIVATGSSIYKDPELNK